MKRRMVRVSADARHDESVIAFIEYLRHNVGLDVFVNDDGTEVAIFFPAKSDEEPATETGRDPSYSFDVEAKLEDCEWLADEHARRWAYWQ